MLKNDEIPKQNKKPKNQKAILPSKRRDVKPKGGNTNMNTNCNITKKQNQELKSKIDKQSLKKTRSLALISKIGKHVSIGTVERIKNCQNFMAWVADQGMQKLKQQYGNSCGNRFCPICAYRLARKNAMKINVMMDYIEAEHGKEFIFLTLTAPNVKGYGLGDEITRYNDAFKKMCKRKEIIPVNKGYIRKLEVTYNAEPKITRDMWEGLGRYQGRPMAEYFERKGLKIGDENPNYDTYHTHFHVIMAVNPRYFKTRSYIKQETWLSLWREAMDDETITQVDVRKVNRSPLEKKEDKAMHEMAKYAAKDTDYMHSDDVFDVFYKALKGRQVFTFNGLFKEANKKYKAKELDKYKSVDKTEYVWYLLYKWYKGEYIEINRRELTEYERRKINKALLEEAEIDDG
jgi:plasmid rolling circle replication initiator protein Rep